MSDSTFALISSVVFATDEAQLLAAMKAAVRSMGYDQVVFGIEMRLPAAGSLKHVANHPDPEAFQTLYRQQAFLGREITQEARKRSPGHGRSLAMRTSARVISILSLGRDRPFESVAEQKYVIDAGTILANCLHVASESIIVPKLLAERRPHLSPRESQCFRLVAEGKSNWDIGQLLAISEAAAAFHVKNVLKKLRVSTRVQAVAIGLAFGMFR